MNLNTLPAVVERSLVEPEECRFESGRWIPRRRLNGDAIMLDYNLTGMAAMEMAGTGIRLSGEDRNIQRV